MDPTISPRESPESWKLFVGQIPRTMRLDQVVSQFRVFGELLEVFIIKNVATGASKGCCFVRFRERSSAERCIEAFNGKVTLPGATHALQISYTLAQYQSNHARDAPLLLSNFPGNWTKGKEHAEITQLLSGEEVEVKSITMAEGGETCTLMLANAADAERASKTLRNQGLLCELGSTGGAPSSPPNKAPETSTAAAAVTLPKLFVGGLTRHTNEAQLLQIFSHYGKVIEVIVLRYPNGQSKLSGFVKYGTMEEANLAISALATPYILPGSPRPLTVRMASPSAPENKLFVGHLPVHFTEEDVTRIFKPHGALVEVHLMRDARTEQPKGCAFVKYAQRADAEAAIKALDGSTTFDSQQQQQHPLKVAFALSRAALNTVAAQRVHHSHNHNLFQQHQHAAAVYHHHQLHHLPPAIASSSPPPPPLPIVPAPQSPSNQYTTFYNTVPYFAPAPMHVVARALPHPAAHHAHAPRPLHQALSLND